MKPDATTVLGQLRILKEAVLHRIALDPVQATAIGMPEHCRVEFAKWPKIDPAFRTSFWAVPENDRQVQQMATALTVYGSSDVFETIDPRTGKGTLEIRPKTPIDGVVVGGTEGTIS
jgi:hypothetical protein